MKKIEDRRLTPLRLENHTEVGADLIEFLAMNAMASSIDYRDGDREVAKVLSFYNGTELIKATQFFGKLDVYRIMIVKNEFIVNRFLKEVA